MQLFSSSFVCKDAANFSGPRVALVWDWHDFVKLAVFLKKQTKYFNIYAEKDRVKVTDINPDPIQINPKQPGSTTSTQDIKLRLKNIYNIQFITLINTIKSVFGGSTLQYHHIK